MGEVTVAWVPGTVTTWPPRPPGWAGACTRCGVLPTLWTSRWMAGWDALGHAALHNAAASRG